MVDFDTDNAIPIVIVCKIVPGRPNLSTVYRWMNRGVGGVRLETFRAGGKRFTDRAAIERFIAACSGEEPAARTPAQREKAATDAEAELSELGV